MKRACFPGSFDPPTIGHRAIVRAVLDHGADRVDLVLSADPLGKPSASHVEERVARLRELLSAEERAHVVRTDRRLLVDIAEGYDLLVVGADKWAQVIDPAWYGGSTSARDAAVAALPPTLVVPRHDAALPEGIEVLRLDTQYQVVSSSGARAGRSDWIWS